MLFKLDVHSCHSIKTLKKNKNMGNPYYESTTMVHNRVHNLIPHGTENVHIWITYDHKKIMGFYALFTTTHGAPCTNKSLIQVFMHAL